MADAGAIKTNRSETSPTRPNDAYLHQSLRRPRNRGAGRWPIPRCRLDKRTPAAKVTLIAACESVFSCVTHAQTSYGFSFLTDAFLCSAELGSKDGARMEDEMEDDSLEEENF